MDGDTSGKEKIIEGIIQDAREEAEAIVREAEKAAEERKEAARRQVQRILEEGEKKARDQAEEVRRQSARSQETDIYHMRLKTRKELLTRILREAEERVEGMMDEPGYREILKNWIVEAALGLAVDRAEVNASKKEMDMIDDSLLEDAAVAVRHISGREMNLVKSEQHPLPAQGVVLTSADGKTAFNNQVHVRMLRYQSEIRRRVNSNE